MVLTQAQEIRDRFLFKLNEKVTQRVQKFIYRYATRRLDGEDVVFLNYGYEEDPAMGIPLSSSDEPNRYCIQLYHSTATQEDLSGKRVLEVGCGHGGGASYLARTLHPASYTGLDLNPTGIEFCQRRHHVEGLQFAQGDAEELPFPDGSFDAVINVESSHLYPHFARFLDEVGRVLAPNGRFLYVDARDNQHIDDWMAALADSPLRLLSHRTINAEVRRGMEHNLELWRNVIDHVTPAPFRGVVGRFAPAQRAYEDLGPGGPLQYRMFCLAKD